MKFPERTEPFLWGAAAGAVALAVIGFSWGGWTTAGKAQVAARTQVDDAVVAALAPVCVERFQRAGDAPAKLVALKAVSDYERSTFIEKGGWAGVAVKDMPDRVSAVARACATLLAPPA
jgi:alpha/beta superfamily hydrolase